MGFSVRTASVSVLYFVALISISSLSPNVTAINVPNFVTQENSVPDGLMWLENFSSRYGLDVEKYQEVNITPTVHVGSVLSRDLVRCARVNVSGLSRLKLGSYSSAHRLTLAPSPEIPEKSYKKIQICLHNNFSRGLCRCDDDYWESLQNGIWSSMIAPYGNRFIDVKFANDLSGSVTVGIKEEFHRWRLVSLLIGLVLLLLAPVVSGWVPFYYSSSMAIGICLVIIVLLFQGMKLLPTGRKNALYSTICGLTLGAGSFLLNRFSAFVNSVLVNFGISEEMHNPVLVFLLVGIVLAGAGFGYWLVRKFVVAQDGTVDVGVAQFVKWALRVIAVTFIFQSTLDTPLAMAVLASILGIYFSIPSMNRNGLREHSQGWRSSERVNKSRAEFLSRSRTMTPQGTLRKKPATVPAWSNSPVKGILSPSSRGGSRTPENYYSTFHKTPNRKRFSKEEWEDFTEESTRDAVAQLASSPEFTDWLINHADRIQIQPEDSSDESVGSGSDSSDEIAGESGSPRGLLWSRW